jgi:hypothetical protein
MAPWAVGVLVRVRVQKADGTLVDISADVRTIERAAPLRAFRGRQNETDTMQPGSLTFVIDNSSGDYTPGRSAASCELMLNMPVFVDEGIGYHTIPIFTGLLQVPDSVEQLEGVDNLITVTAIDRKQALDGGRKFISTLAEFIMTATPATLLHYYPLNEPAAPFRDVVGSGAPFEVVATESSLANPMTTGQGVWTPADGVEAPGDDLRGVAFEPSTSTGGGLGFPQMARTYKLQADFSLDQAVSFASGEPLTLIVWASMTDEFDTQHLFNFDLYDPNNVTMSCFLTRVVRHTSAGADAGLLEGFTISAGSGLDGSANSPSIFSGTQSSLRPFAMQITYDPNSIKVWVGDQEFTDAAPVGSPSSPQYLYTNINLGHLTGSLAHFQIHVGDYTHADFLAQYEAGQHGLAGQRTDERIATILGYAAGDNPAVLDEGSTFMQGARLAGKTPGQAIDTAVTTERGRFFIGPDGVAQFHARTRAYNL